MHTRRKYTGEPGHDINPGDIKRLRLLIRGYVQGVGFRPFVYRLATELNLAGWVCNSSEGVEIEVEGPVGKLIKFVNLIETDHPPQSRIQHLQTAMSEKAGYEGFSIRESHVPGNITSPVLPDLGICRDCLADISDPHNRRFRYPFTNCTNCGPRYSIVESLPYDRPRTTMKIFPMCEECRSEYNDPGDRRFHAQPNACPNCGPHLELWNRNGNILAVRDGALREACDVIRKGEILALKGLGGFHLLVDAANNDAVKRLRRRKARECKPLAIMCPDIDTVRRICSVNETESELLTSTEAPVVLLHRRECYGRGINDICESVAPENPYLGVMLPYTPLHYLLMKDLGFPVVATSGNMADEPICIDEYEALERLGAIADMILIHNRPIARQIDDSVVQVINNSPQVLRNARGYAPLSLNCDVPGKSILAVGAHMKNSIAVAGDQGTFLSQHIGDLDSSTARNARDSVIGSLSKIYEFRPEYIACDLHPDYASTYYAIESGLPLYKVQHHYAHVLSCMADNKIESPVLGVSWDGTGQGTDGTIWGGEFLHIDDKAFARVGHFRTFCLPGGEKAVREPYRAAIGLLYEIFGDELFDRDDLIPLTMFETSEIGILRQVLDKKVNCPVTSSAGRLFDAVSSIIGLCHINDYNGHAAMMLGFAAEESKSEDVYKFSLNRLENRAVIDWEPMIRGIIYDMSRKMNKYVMAGKFHNTLADMIVSVAEYTGEKGIALTGGCFQNRHLSELAINRLEEAGFKPIWHHRIPPNDGGMAIGQIMAVNRFGKGDR